VTGAVLVNVYVAASAVWPLRKTKPAAAATMVRVQPKERARTRFTGL